MSQWRTGLDDHTVHPFPRVQGQEQLVEALPYGNSCIAILCKKRSFAAPNPVIQPWLPLVIKIDIAPSRTSEKARPRMAIDTETDLSAAT